MQKYLLFMILFLNTILSFGQTKPENKNDQTNATQFIDFNGTNRSVVKEGEPTSAGQNALVIVDGKIVNNTNIKNELNPDDIRSINVLNKDDAMAKYGAAGTNGAIVINTKQKLLPVTH